MNKATKENSIRKNTMWICQIALGIALYVVVSMVLKIPIGIGHISLDLGYIVLAVCCMRFGMLGGAIVGGAGCTVVSLLSSGWFPLGWMLGNVLIGIICGKAYQKNESLCGTNIAITSVAVLLGVGVVKTAVECLLFSIPLAVKIPKNMVAAVMDTIVMSIGLFVACRLSRKGT